jgi:phosphoribosylpyrophosphate synthetase
VHALFAGDAQERLLAAGARDVATSDTIRHPSNRFSVLDRLADGVRAVSARTVQGRI